MGLQALEESDELQDIPSMIPDRDDVDSHLSNRRSQRDEIVRSNYYTERVTVSTWPVRIALTILCLIAGGGAFGAYFFYELYMSNLRQSDLRIGDLELRLALVDESAAESDSNLMENIEQTIEQYDLLWANWRANNRDFEDFKGEIARLELVNEGQDETAANNSAQLARTSETLVSAEARLNAMLNDLTQLSDDLDSLSGSVVNLSTMRGDLESIRQALNSGDSTVLGLVGRVEYMEQSMESVNAHRLQINQTLFRLQESVESLQRSMPGPAAGL